MYHWAPWQNVKFNAIGGSRWLILRIQSSLASFPSSSRKAAEALCGAELRQFARTFFHIWDSGSTFMPAACSPYSSAPYSNFWKMCSPAIFPENQCRSRLSTKWMPELSPEGRKPIEEVRIQIFWKMCFPAIFPENQGRSRFSTKWMSKLSRGGSETYRGGPHSNFLKNVFSRHFPWKWG